MRRHRSMPSSRGSNHQWDSRLLRNLRVDSTNVPDLAMSFSDRPFPYGPFVPHWVPKQYIESYFSWHRIDSCLVLNTTVEDISVVPAKDSRYEDGWKLTLRRYDPTRQVDIWWNEECDAVILANGHYSVPFVRIHISFPSWSSSPCEILLAD